LRCCRVSVVYKTPLKSTLLGCSNDIQKKTYDFGLNFGLAFQLTYDLLDYVSDSRELGKPIANDLKEGLATAPVLFAAQEYPELNPLISSKFSSEGAVEKAYNIVVKSNALEKTRQLIRKHSQIAADLVIFFGEN
jgi:geranylgeranyl pyrophosphate synthase